MIVWDEASKTGLLEGHIFLDGSRLHGEDVLLARAGWGVAMVRVVDQVEARAWGPYPGLIQCIDAAEVYAGMMALRLGVPPLNLYSDSAFFVKGWEKGRLWCEAPGRSHADVWRQFWQVAYDFGIQGITVHKVKAHATQKMVDDGEVDAVDRWGNNQADDAAKKGAALHPSTDKAAKDLRTSRLVATACAQWLGVGLECAQRVGALPAELTAAQKASRPRLCAGRRVEVVPDEVWREERRHDHLSLDAHQSHSLHKVGPYFFCTACGCYGAERLVALAAPCQRETTASRRYLLKRLIAGCHPRTGQHLGEVVRVDAGAQACRLPLSASRRRGRSI